MKIIICKICSKESETTKRFKKYCSVKCANKGYELRREKQLRKLGIFPAVEKPKKIFGIERFDWRDYPEGVIV